MGSSEKSTERNMPAIEEVKKKPLDPSLVMPKVDAEPVVWKQYFAVEALRGESYHHVAEAFIREAHAKDVLFRKLQVMDVLSVGTRVFIRFRSDLEDLTLVLAGLTNRGCIVSTPAGTYQVRMGTKVAKYPSSPMCASKKLGFGMTFAGPRIKRWAEQF